MANASRDTSLPRTPSTPLMLERSNALLERARRRIPGITQSMMKRPEHFAPGAFPVYLAHGDGALVTDVDGNEYVDFVCGLGANSLGHRHEALLAAAREALEVGFVHSLPTELEVTTSELLVETVPNAEMARFYKTGADATSAAVRLARAVTGKPRLVTVGYNGWHDHFMFDTPGVPSEVAALTRRMPLFAPADETLLLEAVSAGAAELAAVVLSLPYNREVSAEFLRELRALCTDKGVLLVFDEIVTGLRISLGGAQEYYGVEADLACYSKALAAGMPLSALTGPRRFMSELERLQVSTTFGGEVLSLAVCRAALEIYRSTDYVSHLASAGRKLRKGVNDAARELGSSLTVIGYDAIPLFSFGKDPARHGELMRRFQGLMAARGVLLRRDVNFVSGAHTFDQIEFTIEAARESLRAMSEAAAGAAAT
jgi:aminotransferase MxcL